MSRQPTPRTTPITVIEASTLPTLDSSAMDIVNADAEKVRVFYNITTTEPEVLVHEIMGFQRNAVESALQAGARLIYLKKLTLGGEWMQHLETMGMAHPTAKKLMAVTRHYADPDNPGTHKTALLQNFNKTQLEALIPLPEDIIEELNSDAAIGGDKAKLLQGKTIKQLQQTVLELAQRKESLESLVQKKDEKINDLDTKLTAAKKFKPSKDSEARSVQEQAWLDEAAAAVRSVEVHSARLTVVVDDILNQCNNEAINKRVAEGLRYVLARVNEIANDGSEQLDGTYVPEYLRGKQGK